MDEGTVEVEGKIVPQETLTAPVSGEECVAYECVAKQSRSLIPGGRRYSSVVDSGRDSVLFYVDDGTGRVLIDPESAEIDIDERATERREEESLEYERDTTLKEVRVPDEGRVYVFGSAGWSEGHGRTAIRDGDAPLFKISDSSELICRYRNLGVLSFLTALAGLPVGGWLVLRASGVV